MSFREYLNEGTFAIYTLDSNGKAGPRINVKAIDKGNAEFQAKNIVGVKPYRGYTVDRIEEVKKVKDLKESQFKKGDSVKLTAAALAVSDNPTKAIGTVIKVDSKGFVQVKFNQHGSNFQGWKNPSDLEKVKDLKESKDIYVDLKSSQKEMLKLEDELGDDFFSISWEGFVAVVKPEIKDKFLAALKKLKLKHEVL